MRRRARTTGRSCAYSAMATYKLVYVDGRGRAELVRFILAQAGVKYEDYRTPVSEWQEFRPTTQFGILPMLEFDGKTLSGNGTISRYLAEKYGLAGGSDIENAEIFSVVEDVEDLWGRMTSIFWETNEERKSALRKSFKENFLPLSLTKLDKYADENKCPEGWIHGSKVTYADFAVYILLETLEIETPALLNNFPALARVKQAVAGLPNIQTWLAERPQTAH